MNETKPWYTSTAVWGSVLTLLSAILAAFGYTVAEEDRQQALQGIGTVGAAIGGFIALYGRVKASKRIGAPTDSQVFRIFLPMVLLVPLAGGCAIDPDADPVVVTTERTTATAFDTIDTFLKVEHENRAAIASDLPAVHAFAEMLRKEAPAAFREARAATEVYKASRSAGDGTRMDNALATVQTFARLARQYLLELETKGVR